jgi:hypothetical protein
VCGFRPPFIVLRTRGPASLEGGYGVCPSPYTIFELVRFCCFGMRFVYSFCHIAALLQQVAYLNNRVDASNVHEPP